MAGNRDRAEQVSEALRAASAGDAAAMEQLWSLVYDELRSIAGHLFKAESPDHTLQPTAVVNEAYVRLFGGRPPSFRDRRHFLAVAAKVMRRVLVDHARARRAAKRGGDWQRVSLADCDLMTATDVDVLDLHDALERLAELSERQAQDVELRYFGGLTAEETASQLGVSLSTVKNDWIGARLWLHRELDSGAP